MALNGGYKQSEVGFIPDDWYSETLGNHATFKTGPFGSLLHRSDYVDSGIPIVNPMQIIDGTLVPTQSMTISEAAAKRLSMFRLSSGDVVIGRRGDMGRCAYVRPENDGWLCGTGSMIICCRSSLNSRYLQRVLSSPQIIAAIESASVGTTMINLNNSTLRKLQIPLPPTLHEQEAIAGALSDADAWIESLEQLIAKKRQIKQGAMQELLTGKRRLPGFSGQWETKRLGDHCRFLRNGTNSRADLSVDGPLKYLHYGDIHSCNNVYLSPNLLPSLPMSKANTLDRLQDGDLVLADASEDTIGISKSVEIVGVDSFELVAGLHTIAVRFSVGIFAPRFVGLLQHCPDFNSHLRKLAAGTKVYATNRRHVSSAEVSIPGLAEQTAIASVLSDMDNEIESLEQTLAKAREIKQGMMQELLTGRIRLIEN